MSHSVRIRKRKRKKKRSPYDRQKMKTGKKKRSPDGIPLTESKRTELFFYLSYLSLGTVSFYIRKILTFSFAESNRNPILNLV